MPACPLSLESETRSATTVDDNIPLDRRSVGLLVGPGLRVNSGRVSECSALGESDTGTEYHLICRSNSLLSDGNSSPTSIMGGRHAHSYSLPISINATSNSSSYIASGWNGLEVAEVDFDLSLKTQGHLSVPTLSSSSVDSMTASDDTNSRIKRKLGWVESSEGVSLVDVTAQSSGATTPFPVPPTVIIVKSSTSPSSIRRDVVVTEGDSNSWERPAEDEEQRGQKDEYISSRRRRRLNLIVPNPRKPRTADYMCSLCTEMYQVVVGDNPWWAVYSQQCPQCKQQQVPRIDINSASNAIELDPNVSALYGEGVEDSGDEECEGGSEEEEDADKEEDDEAVAAAAEADQDDLRNDVHPFDGEGLLAAEEASKLLVLMCHARSCTGIHASPKHAEICKSTKYLMLHIRDCSGTDVHGRDCQFPWCLPCKKMLKHLTHCYDPSSCMVCNPWALPESFRQLHCLNNSKLAGGKLGS